MHLNQLLKHRYLNPFLFVVLALLWSGSFINIKIVVSHLPPLFCAMIRALVSILSLTIIFKLIGKKPWCLTSGYWRLWVAGLFSQAIPFAFLFYGEKFIAPALASIINSTVSIWALLLGTIIFRDSSQWTFIKIAGLLIGFLGIVAIFLPLIHNPGSIMGIISVFAMAICYAIGGLITQHIIFKHMKVNFETNLFQQHVISVIFLLILSASIESWPAPRLLLDKGIILSFLYLGVMSTAIAWIIYFYLIKEWGAVRATSVMYIVPLLAILWDLLFLHLIPSHIELLGAVAILSGVILIQWTKRTNETMNQALDEEITSQSINRQSS